MLEVMPAASPKFWVVCVYVKKFIYYVFGCDLHKFRYENRDVTVLRVTRTTNLSLWCIKLSGSESALIGQNQLEGFPGVIDSQCTPHVGSIL